MIRSTWKWTCVPHWLALGLTTVLLFIQSVNGILNDDMITNLKVQGIIRSPKVKTAFSLVDRADFTHKAPYKDAPQYIGHGSIISSPSVLAVALENLHEKLKEGATVLDVGVGSGYMTTLMASMIGITGKLYGIDHIPELIEIAKINIAKSKPSYLTGGRIQLFVADGREGFPQYAPYDVIFVGGAVQNKSIVDKLIQQLKLGGRIVVPTQQGKDANLMQIDRSEVNGEITRKPLLVGLDFIPLTDAQEQLKNQHKLHGGKADAEIDAEITAEIASQLNLLKYGSAGEEGASNSNGGRGVGVVANVAANLPGLNSVTGLLGNVPVVGGLLGGGSGGGGLLGGLLGGNSKGGGGGGLLGGLLGGKSKGGGGGGLLGGLLGGKSNGEGGGGGGLNLPGLDLVTNLAGNLPVLNTVTDLVGNVAGNLPIVGGLVGGGGNGGGLNLPGLDLVANVAGNLPVLNTVTDLVGNVAGNLPLVGGLVGGGSGGGGLLGSHSDDHSNGGGGLNLPGLDLVANVAGNLPGLNTVTDLVGNVAGNLPLVGGLVGGGGSGGGLLGGLLGGKSNGEGGGGGGLNLPGLDLVANVAGNLPVLNTVTDLVGNVAGNLPVVGGLVGGVTDLVGNVAGNLPIVGGLVGGGGSGGGLLGGLLGGKSNGEGGGGGGLNLPGLDLVANVAGNLPVLNTVTDLVGNVAGNLPLVGGLLGGGESGSGLLSDLAGALGDGVNVAVNLGVGLGGPQGRTMSDNKESAKWLQTGRSMTMNGRTITTGNGSQANSNRASGRSMSGDGNTNAGARPATGNNRNAGSSNNGNSNFQTKVTAGNNANANRGRGIQGRSMGGVAKPAGSNANKGVVSGRAMGGSKSGANNSKRKTKKQPGTNMNDLRAAGKLGEDGGKSKSKTSASSESAEANVPQQ